MDNCLMILQESLVKKKSILGELLGETRMQENISNSKGIWAEELEQIFYHKEELIQGLMRLDEGFEALYQKVKDELEIRRSTYAVQIKEIQILIRAITDLSVELEVCEKRNKLLIERLLKEERMQIKQQTNSTKIANNYYKSMNNAAVSSPQFMDYKK